MTHLLTLYIDDDSRRAAKNCQSKHENIRRLQTELISMEKRAISVQQQIDSCVAELNVRFFTLCMFLTFLCSHYNWQSWESC